MATKTIAKITSNPTVDEIVAYLNTQDNVISAEVSLHTPSKTSEFTNKEGQKEEYIEEAMTWFNLEFVNSEGTSEHREIFVISDTYDKSVDSSINPHISDKYTYLSIGMFGSSVEIMDLIAKNFGGYVIPDDCADCSKDNFYHTIESISSYSMPEVDKAFMEVLDAADAEQKYKLFKLVSDNQEVIFDYLSSKRPAVSS